MTLVDTTNRDILLSMHAGEPLTVDVDYDSSIAPNGWVTIYGDPESQDFYFNMTWDEAEHLRDRLNLILGVPDSGD